MCCSYDVIMSTKEQTALKNDTKIEKTSKISICDLSQNNVSEILQKMEYQVPIYLQGYSDLFAKYLHSFNTVFGTCRISEKQFFDCKRHLLQQETKW